ncbi:MAG: hypothetical protein ACRCZF_20925 [Gemmataceae bacterium]
MFCRERFESDEVAVSQHRNVVLKQSQWYFLIEPDGYLQIGYRFDATACIRCFAFLGVQLNRHSQVVQGVPLDFGIDASQWRLELDPSLTFPARLEPSFSRAGRVSDGSFHRPQREQGRLELCIYLK